MVLIEAPSSPSRQVRRLLELANTWPQITECSATATSSCRTACPLRAAEIDKLVAAYQAGATVFELATRFEIHRTTVGRHLKARGIDTRPAAITDDELKHVIKLYGDGWVITPIAKRYGVSNNAIRDRLVAAGVNYVREGGRKGRQ